MAQDKKISELTERLADSISGSELIPFADSGNNGAVKTASIKDYFAASVITELSGESDSLAISQKAATQWIGNVRGEISALEAQNTEDHTQLQTRIDDAESGITAEQAARESADAAIQQSIQILETSVSDSNSRIVILSDTEYEALETKDPDKIYYIYED